MKKALVLMFALSFLAGAAMADSSSPKLHPNKSKTHGKKPKGKAKVALNPQPLPPAMIPVDQAGTGKGMSKTQQ
jgi:hypothetical protein